MYTQIKINCSALIWKKTPRATRFWRPRSIDGAWFKLEDHLRSLLPEVDAVRFYERSCDIGWDDENKRISREQVVQALEEVFRYAYTMRDKGYFPYLDDFSTLKLEVVVPTYAARTPTAAEEAPHAETDNHSDTSPEAQIIHELRVSFKTDLLQGDRGITDESKLKEALRIATNSLDQLPSFDGCRFICFDQNQLVVGFVTRRYTPTHAELAARVLEAIQHATSSNPRIFGHAPENVRADVNQLLIFTDEHNLPVIPSMLPQS